MNRWFMILLLMTVQAVDAGDIQVEGIEQQWLASQLLLKPQYQISSSDVIDEAINSGIELTLIAKLYCQRNRALWIDETISQQQISYQIRYFSLSGQYQLHNTSNDERHSFVSLNALWRHLESKTQFTVPVAEASQSDYLSVRLRLDAGALPSAMQLPVLLSSDWRFKSDWFDSEINAPKLQP